MNQPAATLRAEEWKRLHPATILSDLIRRLPQVLIGVFLIVNSSGGNQFVDTIQLLVGMLAIAPVVVRYVTARYCVDDTLLRWREGLLRRRTVDLPRERIQSVDTRIDLIGRALGLETVVVSSAGGDSEVEIGLVGSDAAARLRTELQRRPTTDAVAAAELPPPPAPPVELAARDGSDLMRVIATAEDTESAVALLAAIWGALVVMLSLNLLGEAALATWISLGTVGTLILVVTTGTSLASRAIGFSSEIQTRRIRVHQGILGRRSQEASLDRVQGMTVRASPVARRLGVESVWVDTADVSGGSGDEQLLIDAVADTDRWRWWAPQLVGTAAPADADLRRVAPISLRRRLIAAGLQSLAAMGLIAVLAVVAARLGDRPTAAWTFAGVAAIAVVVVRFGGAVLRYRNERWLVDDRDLLFIHGAVNHTRTLVPRRRAQSVTMSANWFQRRLGVRSVHIDTAAPSIVGAARDLHIADAEALTDAVIASVDQSGGV